MFVEASPRYITPADAAAFARSHPVLTRVAVTLDATDDELEHIWATFNPDLWQLHGNETPPTSLIPQVSHISFPKYIYKY